MTDELKRCPFCNDLGATTRVRENHHSPTMSGGINEPISVDIQHWCPSNGLPRLHINVTGRDRKQAVDAWNTRTPSAPKQTDGWRPIASAPDEVRVLITSPIALSDGKYFEPEIAYRNGQYWYNEPGMRTLSKPTLWREIPPPPSGNDGKEGA